jgi:membrane-associated HD superfamily phosphohydrolase
MGNDQNNEGGNRVTRLNDRIKDAVSAHSKNKNTQRHSYEDPSHKYLDWVHQLGLEKTIFGRYLNWLETTFSVRKVFTVLLFCLVLSYLIFFQIKIPHTFKVGDATTVDMVSPLTFEMVDEVTTEEKRLKAESNIPVVFDYDTNVFDRLAGNVYRSFRYMRNQMRDLNWPRSYTAQQKLVKDLFTHKAIFEKELGVSLADYLFEWLIEHRFHPRIENSLVRNLDLWYAKKIAESPDRFIPSHQDEVIARVVHKSNSGREFSVSKKDILDLQNPDHFQFIDKKVLEKMDDSDRANLLYLARALIIPNLTLN